MKRYSSLLLLIIIAALICSGCSAMAADHQPGRYERFSGELVVTIADNFQQQASVMRYELLMDGGVESVPLNFADRHAVPQVTTGTRIEIFGKRRNGGIDVATWRIIAPPEKNR